MSGFNVYNKLAKVFSAIKEQKDLYSVMKSVGASKQAIASRDSLRCVIVIDNIDNLVAVSGGAKRLQEITAWADGKVLKMILTSVDDPEAVLPQVKAE